MNSYPNLSGEHHVLDPDNPQPGVYKFVPSDEYHKIKAIGRSALATFKNAPEEWEMDSVDQTYTVFGTQYHSFILEPESFDKLYVEYDGRRDKRIKEYGDLLKRMGSADRIYKPQDKEQMVEMAEMLRNYPKSYKWLTGVDTETGKRAKNGPVHELTIVALCPITGLLLKTRLDAAWVSLGAIVDLKALNKVVSGAFKYSSKKYGADLQPGFYTYVCSLTPGLEHMVNFYFIAQQTSKPYKVRRYPVREWDVEYNLEGGLKSDQEINPVPRLQAECLNLLKDLRLWLDAGKPLPDEPEFITF